MIATTLKRRLFDGPRALQRRYVRGLVSEIMVNRKTATISGPRSALASLVSNPIHLGDVPGSVREWRPQGESNPCFSLERAAS